MEVVQGKINKKGLVVGKALEFRNFLLCVWRIDIGLYHSTLVKIIYL